MYIKGDGVEANERHIAGERILSALEDLTESGFSVRIQMYVNSDGDEGWLVTAVGDSFSTSSFRDSIDEAMCEARDGSLNRLRE